jgi:hypothetical protein
MKPRTLARFAYDWIMDGTFVFDNEERKTEAIKQLKRIISGKATEENNPEDPLVEIHIGVHIPNFDYPIVQTDNWGNPYVWKEDGVYMVPGKGSHMVKGISISGTQYYLSYLESLATYRNCVIKVDKYTDFKRAAYALVCCVSQILNKKLLNNTGKPLKMTWQVLVDRYKMHDDAKEYEKQQKSLYIKWLGKWISTHNKNPDTHMKVLKLPKKIAV